MNFQIKYDKKTDKEQILGGNINQQIFMFNPERYQKLHKKPQISVFHEDEHLFDAPIHDYFRIRFFKRITNLPFYVEENRYMSKEELIDLSKRNGYKDHNQFYMFMTKTYGKYLSKETFMVVRFKKQI